MPYTYLLECSDGSLYTGWTVCLETRLKAHNNGTGAKYTRCRLPVKLVYWEEQSNRSEAQKREFTLRRLKRSEKLQLIKEFNNTDFI